MRLKDTKPSKNYEETDAYKTRLLRPTPDYGPNHLSTYLYPEGNPAQYQVGKDEMNFMQHITPEEEKLAREYGFGPQDIILMRAFRANPGQVVKGWGLRK